MYFGGGDVERWNIDGALIMEWLAGLDRTSQTRVVAALSLLEERGPHLGRPIVDSVRGSVFSHLKELRVGSSRSIALRILFAFAPNRTAVLLVGGNKAGKWTEWYQRMIPLADQRYTQYLERMMMDQI